MVLESANIVESVHDSRSVPLVEVKASSLTVDGRRYPQAAHQDSKLDNLKKATNQTSQLGQGSTHYCSQGSQAAMEMADWQREIASYD